MVVHSIKMHGGRKPNYLALIHSLEPKPLYRAVQELVQISEMPGGLTRLNRCKEWGAPRVPVLSAAGGDGPTGDDHPGNPRPEWTCQVLDQITEGKCKRIRYWTSTNDDDNNDHNDPLDLEGLEGQPNHEDMPNQTMRKQSISDGH